MHHKSWVGRIALAVAFALGIAALAHVFDPPAADPISPPVARAAAEACGARTAEADVTYAVTNGECRDEVEQVAICLLLPECFRNSDCDARCGAGQGRCVHNPCPGRICKCR